ncbi:hypothetical protein AB0M39_23360 [Streptomyces sp. NPDC051907]|uniref:hypothetical protein n=1 Tax=Streptomyces sp. NPDC051907 TaxID=3155284 RepID=UPI003428C4C2
MTPGRCCRAVRAAVFAAVCVLLGSLGHVLMSGAPVPWWVVAPACAATGAVAWMLAGRERGLLPVTAVAVITQGALHSAFSLAQDLAPAASAAPSATGGHAHHAGTSAFAPLGADPHGMAAMPGLTGVQGTAADVHMDMAGMAQMSSTGMLAAHLLAALVCGLWLAHGERAAFRILRSVSGWLVAPLRGLLLAAPPHRPRLRVRRVRRVRAPRRLLLVHAITSRGPPSGIAVV